MSSPTKIMMYTLRSSDNKTFEVSEQVAMMSQTVKHLIDDDCFENGIPLPNVKATVLAKVLEYCNKHAVVDDRHSNSTADEGTSSSNGGTLIADEDLKDWDKTFMKNLQGDQGMLFDLIMATNYMNIKELLDLTCQTVADMIKGKQPEAIRKTFNITNDFSPEEEAEIRRENAWAFK